MKDPGMNVVKMLLLFFGYAALGKFGSYLYSIEADRVYFWPPNALVVAFLLSSARREWSWLLSVVTPAEVLVDLWNGISLIGGLGLGATNLLESWLVAFLLSKYINWDGLGLDKLRDLFFFIGVVVLVPVFTGLFGAGVIYLNGMQTDYFAAWFLWWVGDALGLLIFVLPFWFAIKYFASPDFKASMRSYFSNRQLECFLLLLLTPILTLISLGAGTSMLSIPSLIFPLMVWAAYRFQVPGSCFVIALIALTSALHDILYGNADYQGLSATGRIVNVQIFLGMSIGTTLILAVTLAEKIKTEWLLGEQRAIMVSNANMVALGEMSAGIAHEINNPLAILMGYVSRIKKRTEKFNTSDSEKSIEDLSKIESAAMRIAKIVKGLKNFSRSDQIEPMSPALFLDIMSDTFDFSSEKIAKSGIELRFQKHDNVEIECRSYQIVQVMLNLINNAYDAVLSDKDAWIEISYETSGTRLIVKVTDSGHGIPEKIAEKIMQPFYTTKAVGQGTGLGLSISKGLVEDHGGTLSYNPMSANTQFVLDLPVSQSGFT
jgi:signal transduction histidine kinase